MTTTLLGIRESIKGITITSQETTTTINTDEESEKEKTMNTSTKAYICYEDGTPSEAQTFTSKEDLVKALTDALDMFEAHVTGTSDLRVKEFHCTFSAPKYYPDKNKTWDMVKKTDWKDKVKKFNNLFKDSDKSINLNKFKMDCSNCNKKCRKSKYYDESMSDYCEPDFEV
jgi:hypothetical protein